MAITFDAASTGNAAGFSHTCGGSDRLLLVLTSGSGTLTGVTYNGVALTSLGSPGATAFGATSSVWYLVAPATGTHTIACAGTSLNLDLAAVSYAGASQLVPEVIATTASAAGAATWTSTITTLTDAGWLVVGSWSYFFGNPPSAGAGLTLRQIGATHKNGWFDSNGAVSPAGSVSGTTTQTGGGGWPITHVALAVAPAAPVAITGTAAITISGPALAGSGQAAISISSGPGTITIGAPTLDGLGPADPRVTQIPVEVVEQATTPTVSVTQTAVEVLEQAIPPTIAVTITQTAVEAIYAFSGVCGTPALGPGGTFPQRRLRQWRLPSDPEGRWIFLRRLEIVLQAGVGLTTGQGSDPHVLLSLSHDGGQTWGPERRLQAGKRGQYEARAWLQNAGRYKDGAVRIVVSDPVVWQFLAADAVLEVGTS